MSEKEEIITYQAILTVMKPHLLGVGSSIMISGMNSDSDSELPVVRSRGEGIFIL